MNQDATTRNPSQNFYKSTAFKFIAHIFKIYLTVNFSNITFGIFKPLAVRSFIAIEIHYLNLHGKLALWGSYLNYFPMNQRQEWRQFNHLYPCLYVEVLNSLAMESLWRPFGLSLYWRAQTCPAVLEKCTLISSFVSQHLQGEPPHSWLCQTDTVFKITWIWKWLEPLIIWSFSHYLSSDLNSVQKTQNGFGEGAIDVNDGLTAGFQGCGSRRSNAMQSMWQNGWWRSKRKCFIVRELWHLILTHAVKYLILFISIKGIQHNFFFYLNSKLYHSTNCM